METIKYPILKLTNQIRSITVQELFFTTDYSDKHRMKTHLICALFVVSKSEAKSVDNHFPVQTK